MIRFINCNYIQLRLFLNEGSVYWVKIKKIFSCDQTSNYKSEKWSGDKAPYGLKEFTM
jgi:hypothetical protein